MVGRQTVKKEKVLAVSIPDVAKESVIAVAYNSDVGQGYLTGTIGCIKKRD
ncbi:MAG: hypothetical protein QXV85_09110 [Candidatus Bathyarchaeia archaeon]